MSTELKLVVDRIKCDGRGLCAELLPELVRLDDWAKYDASYRNRSPPCLVSTLNTVPWMLPNSADTPTDCTWIS